MHYIILIFQWGGWALLAGFIVYVFNHGEEVDKWMARIEKFLLWLGLKRDKKYVAKDIRGKINSASKKINKEAESIVTKGIELIWVDQDNIESFLQKGKVVIRMRHYSNQDKNVTNAVTQYVQTGVLNTGKTYLPEKIQEALNLALAKKILSEEADNSTSLDYFFLNTLNPSLQQDRQLEERFETMELMEEKGLFTRILLREVRSLGNKLYPQRSTAQIQTEANAFFNFLEPFARHRGGDNDILVWQFIDTNIQLGILYVGKQDKMNNEGLEPYKRQIQRKIESGCKRIYIFGRRRNNVAAVIALTKLATQNVPNLGVRREYYSEILKGEKTPAVCDLLFIK